MKELIDEMIALQQKKLLACGREFVPTLTSEDVLQPNDYPELEHNPEFRYEEGVLAGMRSVHVAICAKSYPFEDARDA